MKQKNNHIIVALGSNDHPEQHILQATNELNRLLEEVCWSSAVYTLPIGCSNPSSFLNKVAVAKTSMDVDELQALFKEVERRMGRTAEGKRQGIIPIDIDLIRWNDRLLKPDDYHRDYVQAALIQLSFQ